MVPVNRELFRSEHSGSVDRLPSLCDVMMGEPLTPGMKNMARGKAGHAAELNQRDVWQIEIMINGRTPSYRLPAFTP
jgi:hypothetical protein